MAESSSAQSLPIAAGSRRPRSAMLKRTSNSTQISSARVLLGSPRKETKVLEASKPEETMAACFLQYCAMCEKQITTPSSSILYCSEACYRKDSNKPLSAANIMPASPSPPTSPSSPRPILQSRTPTGVTPDTNFPVVRIPADDHAFRSDLDPTEWKPKLGSARPVSARYNSEAFRYLSSFHRAITKNDNHFDDTQGEITFDVSNIDGIMSNAAATAPTTPSLSTTPTTTASSWSMSTSVGYAGAGNTGYDFNTRPLAPRHNRWYSTSTVAGSGIDLVTPHVPPSTNTYTKKDKLMSSGSAQGGLGAFFGTNMQ